MRTAPAGHTYVRALGDASSASFHAPPLRLPRRLERRALWERGGARPLRVRPSMQSPEHGPESGGYLDMASLTPAARRIGSAAVAGLVSMWATLWRDSRRRRQELLTLELLGRLAVIAEGIDRMVQEVHRANLIQHYRLAADQLEQAIDDPLFAAALSTLGELPFEKRRQMLFANKQFGVTLLAYRIGALDWDELVGTMRVLALNPVFAEYWTRTSERRRSLPGDSVEARIARVIDVIVEELAEDPEEWWVVGPAPEADHAPPRATGITSEAPPD